MKTAGKAFNIEAHDRELLQKDSRLYKAVREAFINHADGDGIDEYCAGIMAGIRAVYVLGYNDGYKEATDHAEKGAM